MGKLKYNYIRGEAEYEFNHGHKPRGNGRWAFQGLAGQMLWVNGTYSKAKQEALAKLRSPKVMP